MDKRVYRCAVFTRGGNAELISAADVLQHEKEAGRVEIVALAGCEASEVPESLSAVPVCSAEHIMDALPDCVIYVGAGDRAEDRGAKRLVKKLAPAFLTNLLRDWNGQRQRRRNKALWAAFDGWGKPIPRREDMTFPAFDPLKEYGIPPEKIIFDRTLRIPGFAMDDYMALREKGITFVSHTCWGGLMYNTLGMEMTSPFVNMWMDQDNFLRLAGDLPYYLRQPLIPVCYPEDRDYPMVRLGDVEMHFNHVKTPAQLAEYAEKWYRRRERMDLSRTFVQTCFFTPEEQEKFRERFVSVPYAKIAFTAYASDMENTVYLPDYDHYGKRRFAEGFGECVRECAKNNLPDGIPFDFLKTYLSGRVEPPRTK